MVDQVLSLDTIFRALSDSTRRDIMQRVAVEELSVSEVAKPYQLSLAAVSKHLQILERAQLITKQRRGKEQIVRLSPLALAGASKYLLLYKPFWKKSMGALESYLKKDKA